jgi:hypothetical protein
MLTHYGEHVTHVPAGLVPGMAWLVTRLDEEAAMEYRLSFRVMSCPQNLILVKSMTWNP